MALTKEQWKDHSFRMEQEALRLRDHLTALVEDVHRNLTDPATIEELLEGARAALREVPS